ncbi:MAG: hypothetical protein AB1758_31010 [Candidatus Eremiobacterota bacterium]
MKAEWPRPARREDENLCHGLVHREQLKIQGLPPGSLEVTRANGERFVGQRRVCARGGIPLNGWRGHHH